MVWRIGELYPRDTPLTLMVAGGPAASTLSSSKLPVGREPPPLPQFSGVMVALIFSLEAAVALMAFSSQLCSHMESRSCKSICKVSELSSSLSL